MKNRLALAILCLALAAPAQAGREFINSESDHLNFGSGAFGAPAFTVALWFEANDITSNHNLYTEADSSVNDQYFQLSANGGVAGDWISFAIETSGNDTSSAYSANTWHHTVGVSVASDDRSVFIDGGSEGTAADDLTPSGIDRTRIGAFAGLSSSASLDGTMGPVSGWGSALTDAQIASLGAGRNPLTLSAFPEFHLPMTGGVQQVISGGPVFTNSGTVETGHKPLGWN